MRRSAAVLRLAGDLLDVAARQVEPVERPTVVDVGDLLASGDQTGVLVEAGARRACRPWPCPCRRRGGRAARTRRPRPRSRRSTCRRATRPGSARGRRGCWSGCAASPFSAGTVTISPRNSNTARAPLGEMWLRTYFALALGEPRPRLGQLGGHADLQPPAVGPWPGRSGGGSRPARRSACRRRRPG